MTVVVLGEKNWPAEEDVVVLGFDELDANGLRLLPSGVLEIHAQDGRWDAVDAVVWRGQFDSHFSIQHCLLGLIRASGVRCLNQADALFNCSDRISMHRVLVNAGMPVVFKKPINFSTCGNKATPRLSFASSNPTLRRSILP